MAITRAQQAKQMLQKGGRIGFFKGAQADASAGKGAMSPGTSVSGQSRGGTGKGRDLDYQMSGGKTVSTFETFRGGKNIGIDNVLAAKFGTPSQQKSALAALGRGNLYSTSQNQNIFEKFGTTNRNFQRRQMLNLARKRAEDLYGRLEPYVVGDTDMDYDFSDAPKGLETLTSNLGTAIESTRPNLSVVNPEVFGVLGVLQDKLRPDTQVTLQNTLDKARDYTSLVNESRTMTNEELREALTDLQNRGKTPDQINPPREGGDRVKPIIPVDTTFAQEPVEEKDYYASVGGNPFTNNLQLSRRFRADGGIMNNDVVGGEFDFESARQMYGLGKLVKKVTKTVKKIAKSPIGKAALLYAGTAGLGALGAGAARAGTGFGIFAPSNVLSNVGTSFLRLKASPIGEKIFGVGVGEDMKRTGGLLNLIKDNPMAAIAGASALAGLLTPEQEEEAQELSRGEGIDIEAARRSIIERAQGNIAGDLRARRFRAEGGSMKEPVAKKTMPLLDMGGKEMDLRAEGGFVPIGRMEKADDVPARLSKNEFVFTADAVRNAGDGDVDKGAEVMYNMMKNLESGGDVSEESQGLEGARKMFQTSQRLEEVL